MATVQELMSSDDVIEILRGEILLDREKEIPANIPFTELGLEPMDLLSLCFYSRVRAGDYFAGEALNRRGSEVFENIAKRRGMDKGKLERLKRSSISADQLLEYLTPQIWADFVNHSRGYKTE